MVKGNQFANKTSLQIMNLKQDIFRHKSKRRIASIKNDQLIKKIKIDSHSSSFSSWNTNRKLSDLGTSTFNEMKIGAMNDSSNVEHEWKRKQWKFSDMIKTEVNKSIKETQPSMIFEPENSIFQVKQSYCSLETDFKNVAETRETSIRNNFEEASCHSLTFSSDSEIKKATQNNTREDTIRSIVEDFFMFAFNYFLQKRSINFNDLDQKEKKLQTCEIFLKNLLQPDQNTLSNALFCKMMTQIKLLCKKNNSIYLIWKNNYLIPSNELETIFSLMQQNNMISTYFDNYIRKHLEHHLDSFEI